MSLRLESRASNTGRLEGIDRIMGLFFGRKNKPIQGDRLETVIGASSRFTGDLSVDGGVRIDGQFEGSLEAGGNVVIGEQGRVVADISARHITVGGAVKGNVRATGRLEILRTGHVFGDIHASQVLIDDGGVFQGMGLLGAKDLPALAAPAHDALHPLRDIDPADVAALSDASMEASEAGSPDAEADPVVDPELDEMAQASAVKADPAKPGSEPEIIAPEAKKPAGISKIKAEARNTPRKAGGPGRGLDLNPLDGDLEIEPIIPDLGEPAEPTARNGSAEKDGEAASATAEKSGSSPNGKPGQEQNGNGARNAPSGTAKAGTNTNTSSRRKPNQRNRNKRRRG